jgi:gliding motility-associated-like protein
MMTSNPSLSLVGLTVADNGSYSVQYFVNGCHSAQSGSNSLIVSAKPTINPSANTPLCAGQILELEVECTAGATYEWTGPGGFSSSVCNPIIPNVSPSLHSGTYSVRKRVGGCWSDVIPVNVSVKPKPQVPTAVNAGPYCASSENVMVSVTANSATAGAMYTWYNQAGVPLGGATPSLNFALPNPTQFGNGSFSFYVVASVDGCSSLPSVPTVVSINTIPGNVAEAGPDIDACKGDIITLSATPPTVGTGLWTLVSGNPNGVSIANPDQATTTIAGLTPGEDYVFQWTLSNGACTNYSSDQASVYVDISEEAEAGDPINACQITYVSLNATPPASSIGFWTQPPAQSQLGVVIAEANNPKTLVTGMVPGNSYIFTWTIDGGCGMSSDVVLVNISNEIAFAGANFQVCGDGCTQLNASNTSGVWSSPDPNVQIISPNDPKSIVCNLQPGKNTLVWTINNGACGNFSVDEVIIDFRELTLKSDEANVPFAGKTTLDAIANDEISGFFTIEIIQQPLNGKASVTFDGKITYAADLNFIGDDVAIYQVCIENCDCATASVTFHVGENADCVAPSIITPNHDGINDAFVVPCLSGDRFSNNRLSVFNQWGDEVFNANPYDNNWEGTYDGEDLPPGTYFYIIDFGTDQKPMSGYFIIQR